MMKLVGLYHSKFVGNQRVKDHYGNEVYWDPGSPKFFYKSDTEADLVLQATLLKSYCGVRMRIPLDPQIHKFVIIQN